MTGDEVRQTQPRSGRAYKIMVSFYFILNTMGRIGRFQKKMTVCDYIYIYIS